MIRRHIVPAIGLLLSTSGALVAENLGGLAVGGFVDTIGSASDTQDDGDGTAKGFAATVELRLGYRIGEQVTTQMDLEWNNDGGSGLYLEQAYLNYAITEQFSATAGKFTTYSGWTASDADGLYRINSSPIVDLYTSDLVGGAINYAPSDDLVISGFLINGLFAQGGADPAENSVGNAGGLGAAIDVVYTLPEVGSFNVEVGYDPRSHDRAAYSVGANATIQLASYQPLTIGVEVMLDNFRDDDADTDGDAIGVLLMGNHILPSTLCPMSVTGMLTYVQADGESGVDLGAGTTADSNSAEFALALLTSPTGDDRFGANAELAYEVVSSDAAGSEDLKTISFSLEAIAIIP